MSKNPPFFGTLGFCALVFFLTPYLAPGNAATVNSALPGLGTLNNPITAAQSPALGTAPALETAKNEPIRLAAQTGWTKRIGNHDVYFLQDCEFKQGNTALQSPNAVVWIAAERDKITNIQDVTLYLEGDSTGNPVQITQTGEAKITDSHWFGHWYSSGSVEVSIQKPLPVQDEPAIFQRALRAMNANPNAPSLAERELNNVPSPLGGRVRVGAEYQTASSPHPSLPPRGEGTVFTPLSPGEGTSIVQTQFVSSTTNLPQLPQSSELGFRRIDLNPRGDTGIGIAFEPYYPSEPARGGIVVLTGGINLIVEGITDNTFLSGNTVDISADNAVIWSANPNKLRTGSSYTESDSLDLEVYLEGNIIYRDGPRIIEASRMYYDAKHKVAYILNGHLMVPISEFSPDNVSVNDVSSNSLQGFVRLKAEILRQMGDGMFSAKNTMVTTSRLGEPTYSLRSRSLTFDRRLTSTNSGATNSGGNSKAEPKYRQVIVAENNTIAARNLPVFYWPWIAADIERPTMYLKNFSYGNSGRNGNTVKTLWDPFQIFNLRRPDGVDGEINLTWMGKRGLGHGVNFEYDRTGTESPSAGARGGSPLVRGTFDYWGLSDRGTDQLGGARDSVGFPHSYRYRLHWLHEQNVDFDFLNRASSAGEGGTWNFRGEVGKVSDRNFLNSYFNSDWHSEENATTAIDLTRRTENRTFRLSTEYALDSAYSNANWLPRLDHYWIGESLFNDYLTWYEHTRVGLVDYHTATTPADIPQDGNYFQYLPWETNAGGTVDGAGLVFSTRQELDLPIQAGGLKIVPYVLGDFSAWGKDQNGEAVNRLYGQTGVRLNLPFWKVNPNIGSRTWYLNGLAHKIDFDAEYMYAESNHDMEDLMLTDPMDLWSVDDFRRRYLITNTAFNKTMLPQFDPRYYALRSGLASNVTAGNMEIADDMQMFRFGMTHRFQTKRGAVGNRHILDWITFSTHMNLYPESDQNFGKGLGLLDYNFLWHVGDRFSIFSEGLYDFFNNGQNITRIGGVWNRPDRGSVSLSLDQFSGMVERTYLSLSLGYTMNEKYSMSYITSYDIKDNWRNVGHNFMFERTGESFRLLVGAVYSEALSEWSFSVGLEPVFLRNKRRDY